ncbi:MAG TPA: hypothetical protein VF167_03640 [Longimicrobiaceae bacterium]
MGRLEVLYRKKGRGYTVSLVRRSDRPGLWLRWWDGSLRDGRGDYVWRCLDHEDELQARRECDQLAGLKLAGQLAAEKSDEISITALFSAYESAKTSRKKPDQAYRDRYRMKLWQRFLRDPSRPALSIDPDTVEAYADWRREQGVGDTTIGHEIVFLRGVLDWALTKRTPSGEPLLRFNPIAKVKRLRSRDPHVPVASPRDFAAVLRYSDRVDRQKLLRPLLILVHEHGWRLSAWCQLRASDLDLKPFEPAPGVVWPYGRIRKRSETDKKGKGAWVPLTPRSRKAAALLLRRSAAIGETYLFRAPRAKGHWQVQHALDLLHRAERLATDELRRGHLIGEDEEIRLGGFHALRRKWGSDRKGEPLVDVAEAGQWHPATLLQHYQKADPETTLRVTLRARK